MLGTLKLYSYRQSFVAESEGVRCDGVDDSEAEAEEDDDSWLANLDIDAVVSQLTGTATPSAQVTDDEIPITIQPPILENSQDKVSSTPQQSIWKMVVVIIWGLSVFEALCVMNG
nr:uncharacterized protein LOC109173529 [Ipomoea batatas]